MKFTNKERRIIDAAYTELTGLLDGYHRDYGNSIDEARKAARGSMAAIKAKSRIVHWWLEGFKDHENTRLFWALHVAPAWIKEPVLCGAAFRNHCEVRGATGSIDLSKMIASGNAHTAALARYCEAINAV